MNAFLLDDGRSFRSIPSVFTLYGHPAVSPNLLMSDALRGVPLISTQRVEILHLDIVVILIVYIDTLTGVFKLAIRSRFFT